MIFRLPDRAPDPEPVLLEPDELQAAAPKAVIATAIAPAATDLLHRTDMGTPLSILPAPAGAGSMISRGHTAAVGAAPDLRGVAARDETLGHFGPCRLDEGGADDGGGWCHPLGQAGDGDGRVAEDAQVVEDVVGDLGQLGQTRRRRDRGG